VPFLPAVSVVSMSRKCRSGALVAVQWLLIALLIAGLSLGSLVFERYGKNATYSLIVLLVLIGAVIASRIFAVCTQGALVFCNGLAKHSIAWSEIGYVRKSIRYGRKFGSDELFNLTIEVSGREVDLFALTFHGFNPSVLSVIEEIEFHVVQKPTTGVRRRPVGVVKSFFFWIPPSARQVD
jgi:hypothetical protein